MAFKLSKTQQAQGAVLLTAMQKAYTELESARDTYQGACEAAREFANDIAQTASNEIADKSERWQEGDKGVAAAEWAEAWSDWEVNEVDLPDSAAESFEELPVGCEP